MGPVDYSRASNAKGRRRHCEARGGAPDTARPSPRECTSCSVRYGKDSAVATKSLMIRTVWNSCRFRTSRPSIFQELLVKLQRSSSTKPATASSAFATVLSRKSGLQEILDGIVKAWIARHLDPLDRPKHSLSQQGKSGICRPDIAQQHDFRRSDHRLPMQLQGETPGHLTRRTLGRIGSINA
jgi:hypothetical protein